MNEMHMLLIHVWMKRSDGPHPEVVHRYINYDDTFDKRGPFLTSVLLKVPVLRRSVYVPY